MTDTSSILSPTYTCNICRRTFNFTGPTVVGQSRETKLARVGNQLAKHMADQHQQQMAETMMAGTHHVGWLITAKVFSHNDPDLTHEQLVYRLRLRGIVDEVVVTDERIEQQVHAVFPHELIGAEAIRTEAIRTAVIALLKGMRDAVLETGQFDPLKKMK